MTSGIDAPGGRPPGLPPGLAPGLGPHVVGARVVVRRRLPGEVGPSGGPAMTDLLGVCLAWGDEACVVQPESGAPVEIPITDIVSGKPVPPRPSPRLRVTPADAQRRALAQWPDLVAEPLGEWVLRASEESSARRANSVLACGDPGVPDPVASAARWYAERARRPIAAVLAGGEPAGWFEAAGWVPESGDADTLFMLVGVSSALRRVREGRDVEVSSAGDHAVVRTAGLSGVAAYGDGWVGLRSIEVAPEQRRRGLGLAVVAALLDWGAERGAETAYLQVLADNVPALGLYERLGFVVHHAYRYLAAPVVATTMQKPPDVRL